MNIEFRTLNIEVRKNQSQKQSHPELVCRQADLIQDL